MDRPNPNSLRREQEGKDVNTPGRLQANNDSMSILLLKDLDMFGLAVLASCIQRAHKNIISPSCSYCWLLKLPIKSYVLISEQAMITLGGP